MSWANVWVLENIVTWYVDKAFISLRVLWNIIKRNVRMRLHMVNNDRLRYELTQYSSVLWKYFQQEIHKYWMLITLRHCTQHLRMQRNTRCSLSITALHTMGSCASLPLEILLTLGGPVPALSPPEAPCSYAHRHSSLYYLCVYTLDYSFIDCEFLEDRDVFFWVIFWWLKKPILVGSS